VFVHLAGGFMPQVTFKIVLVPDLYGACPCKQCHGYGWVFGYGNNEPDHVDCENCLGYGFFREETEVVPANDGEPLQSKDLKRDSYGRYVHSKCNGGGVRFFTQKGEHYWTCTSCKEYGSLSLPEWRIAQERGAPINLFANAKGAEQLQLLRCAT
jgi:hypothetical protein